MNRIFTVAVLLLWSTLSFAQINYKGSFGKGIRFKTEDGTFGLKIGVRVQPRWDNVYNTETKQYQQQAWIKRGRLKFDGFMLNEDLRYKIEFDVVGGYVRDAMVKYRFSKHSDLWFGQGKLPGNRERIVSSGNLQFADRSVFNSYYTLDRDVGFQFHHYFEVGDKMIIRDVYALSTGNGILNKQFKPLPSVTAKVEVLPFGFFTKKGDYSSGDLVREETLKMAIAFGADYNMDSYKSRSHIGSDLGATKDLLTLNGDVLMKLNGWSFMAEWGARSTPNDSAVVYDASDIATSAYYTGWGMNFQTGYLFKNNWEVAARYAFTNPDDLLNRTGQSVTYYHQQADHTIGITKYIVGHKLKVQTDFTYRSIQGKDDLVIARLQMEVHF